MWQPEANDPGMPALAIQPSISAFSSDVAAGLSASHKYLPSQYLYDPIGISLLDTISKLPENGIARAEERILIRHSEDLAEILGPVSQVAKLWGGDKRATAHIVRSLCAKNSDLQYRSLHLPGKDGESSGKSSRDAGWLEHAADFISRRRKNEPVLLMLLGASSGNLSRAELSLFLQHLRDLLQPGDFFLFAADLIKDPAKMLSAHDDAIGLMAALHKNLLARINRELGGHFCLRRFDYTVKWNALLRRAEMYLLSLEQQEVFIGTLDRRFHFDLGETIQTQFACKFSELEVEALARQTGFTSVKTWTDLEWGFEESLWTLS